MFTLARMSNRTSYGPGAKILHVGAYESEDIATVHDREKVVEEKCQTSIKLDHLVLENMLVDSKQKI